MTDKHACQCAKMLVQEAEERVFTSVSNLKSGARGADNDEDEEDADSKALLRSESLSPALNPDTLTYLYNTPCNTCSKFAPRWRVLHRRQLWAFQSMFMLMLAT